MQSTVQSGRSIGAKNGGAFFWAVYWSNKDPMAAPGPYETIGPSKSVGIAPAERAKTEQLQSRFK